MRLRDDGDSIAWVFVFTLNDRLEGGGGRKMDKVTVFVGGIGVQWAGERVNSNLKKKDGAVMKSC